MKLIFFKMCMYIKMKAEINEVVSSKYADYLPSVEYRNSSSERPKLIFKEFHINTQVRTSASNAVCLIAILFYSIHRNRTAQVRKNLNCATLLRK